MRRKLRAILNNTEFLQGLRDQDPAAVRHLTECYVPSVWRYVCDKVGGDQHLAEDIVSEAVLALIRAVSTDAAIQYPGAWLRKVAGRRVQDHFRAVSRVRHLVQQVQHVAEHADENDAVQQQLAMERRQEVVDVMDALKPQQRMVLEWKYIEKLSVRTIAERLDVTEKTVEATLFRARQKFKKVLAAVEKRNEPEYTGRVDNSPATDSGSNNAERRIEPGSDVTNPRLQTGLGGS